MENDMADQLVVSSDPIDQTGVDEHNQEMLNLVDSQEVPTDRPEMVDDKFGGDYDKLKQSYDELEKKFHSPEAAVQEDLSIPQSQTAEGYIDMTALTQEYATNGELSDKSYQDLEEAGISREYANNYIAGQKALGQQIGDSVKNSVGGDAEYSSMVEWAKNNYTQEQIQAYDNAVNSGSVDAAMLAAKGLRADYQNIQGQEGDTYSGRQAQPEGRGEVFRSNAEVVAAMKDPRYEYDTAYRQDVLSKLDQSDIFSQGRL